MDISEAKKISIVDYLEKKGYTHDKNAKRAILVPLTIA